MVNGTGVLVQITVTGSNFGDWGLQRFGGQQKKVCRGQQLHANRDR